MKTGERVSLKGTDAKFYDSYKEKSNVIVYHLYDTVSVKGNVTKGIDINLYGGKNKDYFKDESSVKESKKLTKIYDLKIDSNIDGNEDTDDQTTDDPEVVEFDRVGVRKKE